ncbi:uncharacterized protein [Nicotiana tomentosiformis]|uniref:uncharacterized protein isoform X1 n=1 Tax=Nicotiana tomentosiformis TaxID=4098 RepID=UPI00388C9C99
MPKIKRFRNPLKSAREPHDAHGHSSSSATPVQSHAIEPSTAVQAPPHAHEVPQQEQAPILPSNSSATSRRAGRESIKYWTVEAKDSENATKQIRVKVNEVNNLTVGERIVVNFDDYNAAYGEAQGLLAGYCGSLAIDCNLFPISFEKWSGPSGMPKKYMEDCFETILKPRFDFRVSESIAYRYCNASLSKKWATHRQKLWNEYFDPAKSKNEIISNVPAGINKDQWASFVAYRQKSSTMELCRRNKEIRKKQKMPHTGGSKANSRRRYELFLETGKTPSRGKMFIETHKKANGSFVNDAARTIGEQIELNMTQCDTNECEVSPNDVIGKMLGVEHSGRVRCMGMGASPSNTFGNTKGRLSDPSVSSSSYGTSSATYTHLQQKLMRVESQLEGTLTALKAYVMSKEGLVPEEFAGLFALQPQPDDAENEPTSPVDVRGSSADNNANYQSNA